MGGIHYNNGSMDLMRTDNCIGCWSVGVHWPTPLFYSALSEIGSLSKSIQCVSGTVRGRLWRTVSIFHVSSDNFTTVFCLYNSSGPLLPSPIQLFLHIIYHSTTIIISLNSFPAWIGKLIELIPLILNSLVQPNYFKVIHTLSIGLWSLGIQLLHIYL